MQGKITSAAVNPVDQCAAGCHTNLMSFGGLTALFTSCARRLQSPVLLILRLTWGWQLCESGYGHLTHIQRTIDAFKGWGVPLPGINVYISGVTELVGGSLLILGLATRYISLPLVFNFIVAIAAASRTDIADAFRQKGFLDAWDTIINDSAFPFLMLAMIMLAFGPGAFSLDRAIGKWRFRRTPPETPARS